MFSFGFERLFSTPCLALVQIAAYSYDASSDALLFAFTVKYEVPGDTFVPTYERPTDECALRRLRASKHQDAALQMGEYRQGLYDTLAPVYVSVKKRNDLPPAELLSSENELEAGFAPTLSCTPQSAISRESRDSNPAFSDTFGTPLNRVVHTRFLALAIGHKLQRL